MVGNNSNLEIFNRIKETNANSADEYNNTKTYVKDEYCIYNNTLYKANQAIDTAEEFTESHWTETTVGTELKSQADSISALNSRIPYAEVFSTVVASLPAGQNTYFTIPIDIPEGFIVGGVTLWCGGGTSGRIPVLYSTPNGTLYGFVRNENDAGENVTVYAECIFVPAKS